MISDATIGVNLLYGTITLIVSVVGCFIAIKQNRKRNEEEIKKTVDDSVNASKRETDLKIQVEKLEREKLQNDLRNIHSDNGVDKGRIRDLSNDVSKLKNDTAVNTKIIESIKGDFKEFKDHHETSEMRRDELFDKLFGKLDEVKDKQANDNLQILQKINDLSLKIPQK